LCSGLLHEVFYKTDGCNFFIQYKRSNLISRRHCNNEYDHWGSSYLRFSIFYTCKKSPDGKDFTQFDKLRELSALGYSTYYVTNHVIDKTELFELARSQRLLEEIPFLNVADIDGRHHHVTFTKDSEYFMLHSKPVEAKVSKWNSVIDKLKLANESKKVSKLEKDIEKLRDFIVAYEESLELTGEISFRKDFKKLNDKLNSLNSPRQLSYLFKTGLIANYLKQYFNVDWYRFCTN